MLMQNERETIVRVGKILFEKNLVQLCGGNISLRDPKTNLIAIKPSNIPYIEMKPEDVVVTDLNMNVFQGSKKPSTEIRMHTSIYKARPDILAIVHCHPPYAVAWSLKGKKYLPSVLAAMALTNGAVMVAPYEDPGTQALADSAVRAIGADYAAILQAHGIVCAGRSIQDALEMAFIIEDAAKIACIAETLPGETFTIDAAIGKATGVDTTSKLR